jgi:indoleamine 2,3-dioxygenase
MILCCTFTGSSGEQWFYRISIAIEGMAASTVPSMINAIAAARAGDVITVTECLRTFSKGLQGVLDILNRMS